MEQTHAQIAVNFLDQAEAKVIAAAEFAAHDDVAADVARQALDAILRLRAMFAITLHGSPEAAGVDTEIHLDGAIAPEGGME